MSATPNPTPHRAKVTSVSIRSKQLNTLAKALDEIVALSRLAGYSGKNPEDAAAAIRRALANKEAASPGASVSSSPKSRAEALWEQYHALPVEKRNAFYIANRNEMVLGK
jgi:hypothetical protein